MNRRQYVVHFFSLPYAIEKLYSQVSSFFHQIQVPALKKFYLRNLTLYWKADKFFVDYEQQLATKDKDPQKCLPHLYKL